MERVGGDGRCKPSCFFLRRIDVFLADLRLYARGSPQGPKLGTDALAELGTPSGWWAGIDALAELGAKAGWLQLAELGAGGLVDAGGAHVISMPFGSKSCQENSGRRSTNGSSCLGESNLLRREYMRSSCGPRPRAR